MSLVDDCEWPRSGVRLITANQHAKSLSRNLSTQLREGIYFFVPGKSPAENYFSVFTQLRKNLRLGGNFSKNSASYYGREQVGALSGWPVH
jgi:hypothetical protein